MRTALLTATLAGLVLVAPCAAQTSAQPAPQKPIAHKPAALRSESPKIFIAVLSGAYEVPPVDTHATGTVELTWTGTELRYQVHVDSIRDVAGAYLHIGRAGSDAPAVADLFDGVKAGPVSGLLARGTLTKAQLHETTMARLMRALRNDGVYVTVHTLALRGGELRGQLRVQPAMATR
jgi:hypothetical protein